MGSFCISPPSVFPSCHPCSPPLSSHPSHQAVLPPPSLSLSCTAPPSLSLSFSQLHYSPPPSLPFPEAVQMLKQLHLPRAGAWCFRWSLNTGLLIHPVHCHLMGGPRPSLSQTESFQTLPCPVTCVIPHVPALWCVLHCRVTAKTFVWACFPLLLYSCARLSISVSVCPLAVPC